MLLGHERLDDADRSTAHLPPGLAFFDEEGCESFGSPTRFGVVELNKEFGEGARYPLMRRH